MTLTSVQASLIWSTITFSVSSTSPLVSALSFLFESNPGHAGQYLEQEKWNNSVETRRTYGKVQVSKMQSLPAKLVRGVGD